ncbi:unnamed protein product [Dibothriocephalus latus]|uniref:Uncharacterized protein n=1 Tax=Dibothriocephalus latus TaxID=60516 RepID=A0A3P6U3U2_DIBLA|nr:unnamed protein product [Dibothriocephalus latus]
MSPLVDILPRKQRVKRSPLAGDENRIQPLELTANLESSMRGDDQVESGCSTETLVSMRSQSGSREDVSKNNEGRIEVQEVDDENESHFQGKSTAVMRSPKKMGNSKPQDGSILTREHSSAVKHLTNVAEGKKKVTADCSFAFNTG